MWRKDRAGEPCKFLSKMEFENTLCNRYSAMLRIVA